MNGGVLKFLQTSPERGFSKGKKCFPERSVGVSKQSPSEFQLRSTLVNPDGYVWTQPVNKLFSHTTYISAVGSSHTNNTFKEEHDKKNAEKKGFNRKKGLLSEFMDNHSWKRAVDNLMGFERSEEGRNCRNIEVERSKTNTERSRAERAEKRVKSARKPAKDALLYQTLPTKLEEKNAVRTSRNKLHENQLAAVSTGKRRIKLKNNQSSFLNSDGQQMKLRLFHRQMHNTTRSQSQNCQTIQEFFGSTTRSDMPNMMKFRKSFEETRSGRSKPSRSVVEDGMYKEQIEEFQSKFLKNGLFKKARSSNWQKILDMAGTLQ